MTYISYVQSKQVAYLISTTSANPFVTVPTTIFTVTQNSCTRSVALDHRVSHGSKFSYCCCHCLTWCINLCAMTDSSSKDRGLVSWTSNHGAHHHLSKLFKHGLLLQSSIHCVPNKWTTQLMVTTLSKPNRFSNFSPLKREVNYKQNLYKISYHT